MAQVAVAERTASSDAARSEVAREARRIRWPEALLVAAVVLALVPIAASAVRALGSDWFPTGDNGLVYARTTDVFTTDTPLIYMWSAGSTWADHDFNNPGPSLYWLLAAPTAAFGPNGMVLATALLNGAAVVGLALVARRRGPLIGVLAVAVAATLSWTMGSTLLTDPWPPNSLLLPTLLFLVLAWAVADGDVPALPFLAGVGTLLLQTNLSYAVLAPGLAVFAVVALGLRLRRERREDPAAWPRQRRRTRRAVLITAAVTVVLWTPAVVEQLSADGDGNLARIAEGMGQVPVVLGPRVALRLLTGVTVLPSWWSRSSFVDVYVDQPSNATATVMALVVVAVLAGLAWTARRRHDGTSLAGIATAACALLLAFVTTARSPVDGFGELAEYRTRYLWAVAAFATLVVVVASARWLLRASRPRLVATAALTGVIAVVAAANLPRHDAPAGTHEPLNAMGVVRELRAQLADVDPDRTVMFDMQGDSFAYPFWAYATIAELVRRDVPLRVKRSVLVRTLGDHREYTGLDDVDVVMTMRTGERALHTPNGTRRIALREGLHPEERAELRSLRDALVEALDRGEVGLTAEGARALERLGGDDDRREEPEGQAQALVDQRQVGSLVAQGFLDIPGRWRERVGRYLYLEDRSEDRTVAVFVRPAGGGRSG